MTSIELSKQLRIGNYVQSKPLSIPRLQISSDGIMTVSGYGISVLESDTNNSMGFSPIPLTEEWLTKFGWKHVNTLRGGEKTFEGSPYIYYSSQGSRISILTPPIKWVHQFQNLIFAIRGEELEVK